MDIVNLDRRIRSTPAQRPNRQSHKQRQANLLSTRAPPTSSLNFLPLFLRRIPLDPQQVVNAPPRRRPGGNKPRSKFVHRLWRWPSFSNRLSRCFDLLFSFPLNRSFEPWSALDKGGTRVWPRRIVWHRRGV